MNRVNISCFFLAWIAIYAPVVSFYNCENGVYDTLKRLTRECRQASYVPTLRSLRKKEGNVMGEHIADMMDEYCKAIDKVDVCMADMIDLLPCLSQQLENYQTMMARSNWMCKPKVKEKIQFKFSGLPMLTLDPHDHCYKQAAKLSYTCVRSHLGVRNHSPRQTTKLIFASLPCTYRKLKKTCPKDKAKLYTVLSFDWIILPPALGLNISERLFKLD